MREARRLAGVLFAATLLLAATPAVASVVVFPLDARGVAFDTAQHGTEQLLQTLRVIEGVTIVDPKEVAARIGVDLTEQAKKCEYDVFCLVEIGEILQGKRLLIGHLRQTGEGDQRAFELKLIVLDVAKAAITEVLIWSFPANDSAALEDATQAAARRLFAKPDVRVQWNVEPKSARMTVFKDPVAIDQPGPVPFWSGAYHARFEAAGYHPLERRIVIAGKKRGALVNVDIEMEQDPLYVKTGSGSSEVNPFEKSSRRLGSGVSSQVVAAIVDDEQPSPFLNPIAWAIIGAGAVLSIVGVVISSGAQSDYNELSSQSRFTPGVTVTAEVAMRQRDDQSGTYATGGLVVGAGVAVAIGGLAWMLVEQALMPDDRESSAQRSTGELDGADRQAADAAAAEWARALYGSGAR